MKEPKRLVLADPLAAEGVAILEGSSGIMVEDLSDLSRDELKQRIPGAAGLVVRSRTQVDRELIETATGLEVIGRAGVGTDNIDLSAATRRGVAVLNAPAGNTISTAELAFGLLVAAARGISTADRSMHDGRWERRGQGCSAERQDAGRHRSWSDRNGGRAQGQGVRDAGPGDGPVSVARESSRPGSRIS